MTEVLHFPPPPIYASKTSGKPIGRPIFSRKPVDPSIDVLPIYAANEKSPSSRNQTILSYVRQLKWPAVADSKFWDVVNEWWLWELLSWIFAALCIIAIIALLGVYQGQQLPTWPWGLTLNAYVSVLGAFAKAALLLPTAEALGQLKFNWFASTDREVGDFEIFDQASRGPWGSLLLLWRTRGRALAALGASVIVLSIALDPFFQQVLLYPSRVVPTGQSTISRSRIYSANLFTPPEMTLDGLPLQLVDYPITYFVGASLYYNTTPSPPAIPMDCTTGNCTWAPFETLGVCSACSDISNLLQYACLDSENDWVSNTTNGSASTFPQGVSCGYFLNSTTDHPMLVTGYGLSSNNNETLIGRFVPLNFPPPSGRPYLNNVGSIHFRHIPDPIVDVLAVFTPGGYNGVKVNSTPVALECNLHWCIQTVQSTFQNGTLKETVLSTFENTTSGSYNNTWMLNVADGYNTGYDGVPTIKSPTSGEIFGVDSNETAFTVDLTFMEAMYSSFATAENASSPPVFRRTSIGGSSAVRLPFTTTPWYDATNITMQFQRLSQTLTSVARSVSNGTDLVPGVAWANETYILVRWEWLSLPVALLTFSLVFLVASIYQSRVKGMEVCKTSALAVLLHGLRNDEMPAHPDQRRSALSDSRIFTRSRTDHGRLLIRLRGKKGRWRFSTRSSRARFDEQLHAG